MSSKMKPILIGVKIVVFLAACIFGYMFYQNYAKSQKNQEELKKLNKVYNDSKWAEAVEGFKGYAKKHPDKKHFVNSKISISLQNMANDKSIKAIAIPKKETAKKQAANQEVIKQLMEAKEYGDLNEMSMIILCEAYIECNDIGKAQGVIKEYKSRNKNGTQLAIQETRIKRMLKKK